MANLIEWPLLKYPNAMQTLAERNASATATPTQDTLFIYDGTQDKPVLKKVTAARLYKQTAPIFKLISLTFSYEKVRDVLYHKIS